MKVAVICSLVSFIIGVLIFAAGVIMYYFIIEQDLKNTDIDYNKYSTVLILIGIIIMLIAIVILCFAK